MSRLSGDQQRVQRNLEDSGDEGLRAVNKMVANQGPEGVAASDSIRGNPESDIRQVKGLKEYLSELTEETISNLNSGEPERIELGLSSINQVMDQPGVAKAFIEWANAQKGIIEGSEWPLAWGLPLEDATRALVTHLSNPRKFLELAPDLEAGFFSQQVFKEVVPCVNSFQSDVESLADHFYERFRKASSPELREATARFLCNLDVEKLVPTLALHLNNQERGSDGIIVRKEFSIEERTLIASILGHQAKYSYNNLDTFQQAAGALFDQVFPKPYAGFGDCLRSNLAKYSVALAAGITGGVYLSSFIARVLPKSIFVTPEVIFAGAVAGGFFACRLLYKGIPEIMRGMNELVVKTEDQHEDVRLAAAKGLACMLNSGELKGDIKQNVLAAIGTRLDKTAHGEVTGVLREALEGPGLRIDLA